MRLRSSRFCSASSSTCARFRVAREAELDDVPDQRLAAAVAGGDAKAFAALVRRHERVVRGFLMRLAPVSGRADDLAQETFLTAWEKASAYTGQGRYRGWLLRIAWTTFLMDARARGRRLPEHKGEREAPEPSAPASAEDRAVLDDALGRLSDEDRAAVLLCHVLEHSHSEAAAILDMPLGTLKTRVARGTRQLLEILGDEDDE